MILVDYKKGGEKKDEDTPQKMVDILKGLGHQAAKDDLKFSDVMFEGKGPNGLISIGIERKTLHDMLHCIHDGRLSGHQLIGMNQSGFDVKFILLEGYWRVHEPDGWLMESWNGGQGWGYCTPGSNRPGMGRRILYSELYRYLLSLQLGGFILLQSPDLYRSCVNISECYHYFQKKWDSHTALLQMQRVVIPTMNFKPSLTREWAFAIQGIGEELSALVERQFRTPIRLATASEAEWLAIPGIGAGKAKAAVEEILGGRR